MADFERARMEHLRAKFRRPTIDVAAVRDLVAARRKGGRRRAVALSADQLATLIARPAQTKRPPRA